MGLVELVLEHVGQRDNASAARIDQIRRVFGSAPAAA
jgi:hypothetical protein